MDLLRYSNKLAGSLSGGNKRKLCVAIAMIAQPQVIFLDEPSTGVDPVARRFMWDIIAEICTQRRQTTVVLTTHNMEECEALCTRVGIMVGGHLRCLGSVTHLRSRYGRGFQLEVKISYPDVHEVQACLARHRIDRATMVTLVDAKTLCETLGSPELAAAIGPDSATGGGLYHTLQSNGTTSVSYVTGWFIMQGRTSRLCAHIGAAFPDGHALLEQHEQTFRFNLSSGESLTLGGIFGRIEAAKDTLDVVEYTVSQTSLEQVFNGFAAQQQEETGHVRGLN
jgi:ATP-binding cassette subfamily A (ABC1) protein 1